MPGRRERRLETGATIPEAVTPSGGVPGRPGVAGRRRVEAAGERAACTSSATPRAVSVSGPGAGTNSACPVVLELLDALDDVGQRPVAARFSGGGEVHPRVPAAGQLLDRGHVDHPVVQVVVELGHVAGQEAAVGRRSSCRQRRAAAASGTNALDVGEHLLLGLGERHAGVAARRAGPDAACMLADDVAHLRPARRPAAAMTRSTPSPSTLSSESVTSDRDLDQRVLDEVEPGHLAVDPDDPVLGALQLTLGVACSHGRHCTRRTVRAGRRRIRRRGPVPALTCPA